MTHIGEHAVVLGASMGGLLAARVLADHCRSVTVVERDELATEPLNRRGVPQGRQPHALLARASGLSVTATSLPAFPPPYSAPVCTWSWAPVALPKACSQPPR